MHSFRDEKDNRLIFVACCECDRGGNGADKDKCSCGWQVKRWNHSGCFAGILMPKFEAELKAKQAEVA